MTRGVPPPGKAVRKPRDLLMAMRVITFAMKSQQDDGVEVNESN
jgi:hypothetical protein